MGTTLGPDVIAPLRTEGSEPSPREAFADVVLAALRRPPCVVSFSGGRDSSAILAVAVGLAREHGLAAPIAVTNRFPRLAETDESDWQAAVLAALGVRDQVVLSWRDELAVAGPVAADLVARIGPRWPVNTHMHAPIAEVAAGGSLLTGFGGDEVGRASEDAHLGRLLDRRRRPRLADLPQIAFLAAPDGARRAVHRRRQRRALPELPWLTDEGRRRAVEALATDAERTPRRFDRLLVDAFWTSRYAQLVLRAFSALGTVHDVAVAHPFADPLFLRACATSGRAGGVGSRARLLKDLTAGTLGDDVLLRRSKATFERALWSSVCDDAARAWSGEGFDPAVICATRLRAEWLRPERSVRSYLMLQWAWAHDRGFTSASV